MTDKETFEVALDPDLDYVDATPSIVALTEAVSNLSQVATKQLETNGRLIVLINDLYLRVSQLEAPQNAIIMPPRLNN